MASHPPPRCRIRSLLPKLPLGSSPPGPKNSLTDVPGVLVHTQSIHTRPGINTGVTTILPRRAIFTDACYAGTFTFNGAGEMSGTHWIAEAGTLNSPIILTGSLSVGEAYRGVYEYAKKHHSVKVDPTLKHVGEDSVEVNTFTIPVVAETYDGYLSDVAQFAVKPEDVVRGIEEASDEAVKEGNTGGGTEMVCHLYKGGTGSSSRVVEAKVAPGVIKKYTIGALVQCNYGSRRDLCISGIPIGSLLSKPSQPSNPPTEGSIIIIVATDAPLLPIQLQRLAKRATVGLARVGGYGHNGSGDIFLAFSTAAVIPVELLDFDTAMAGEGEKGNNVRSVETLDDDSEAMTGLFHGVAEAVEEAIYNALCMAETMVGFKGRRVEALDLERVRGVVEGVLRAEEAAAAGMK